MLYSSYGNKIIDRAKYTQYMHSDHYYYYYCCVDWTGSNADMPRGPAQLLQESLTI